MKILIDESILFDDLKITRNSANGDIEFEGAVIEKIFADSDIDIDDVTEDLVSEVLILWYQHHIKCGGRRDTVMEIIAAEIETENKTGQIEIITGGRIQ